MTDSEILKNIELALINKGVIENLNDLSKKLPHSYSALNRIKRGELGYNISPGIREKLESDPFNVSRQYMLNGIGSIFKYSVESKENNCREVREENKALNLRVASLEEKTLLYKQIMESHIKSLTDKERIIEEKDKFIKEKERIILEKEMLIEEYRKREAKRI